MPGEDYIERKKAQTFNCSVWGFYNNKSITSLESGINMQAVPVFCLSAYDYNFEITFFLSKHKMFIH